jgi:hypothetical protein
MGQCAPEDSISQCPFLQMIDTAGNPHADGSAAPGARPRHRPSRHRDPPATSRAHDNWMAARQTSCRQQTAPPPPRCSKDVTAHPHRPGARPGRPCQVPARSGQPLSGRSGFSPAFGTEFFFFKTITSNRIAMSLGWGRGGTEKMCTMHAGGMLVVGKVWRIVPCVYKIYTLDRRR